MPLLAKNVQLCAVTDTNPHPVAALLGSGAALLRKLKPGGAAGADGAVVGAEEEAEGERRAVAVGGWLTAAGADGAVVGAEEAGGERRAAAVGGWLTGAATVLVRAAGACGQR